MWKEFLANGTLGSIRLRQSIDEVLQMLGPPEDREWRKDGGVVFYCDYALRIVHVKGAVYSYAVYFKPGTPQKPVLPSIPGIEIPFSGLSTMREVISYVDSHGIFWRYDTRLEEAQALLMGESVSASFDDDHLFLVVSGPGAAAALAKQKKP